MEPTPTQTKMHPTKKILLLTCICCSLTNCSNIFTGTSSDVQINSQPSGASSLRASQLGGYGGGVYSSRAYGSDDIGIFGTPNLGSKPTAVIERDGDTSRIYGGKKIGIFGTANFGAFANWLSAAALVGSMSRKCIHFAETAAAPRKLRFPHKDPESRDKNSLISIFGMLDAFDVVDGIFPKRTIW
jgi:hypothetical protein